MSSEQEIQPVIGVIGGSGLYDIDGLENKEWRRVETPWGEPSDELLFGTFEGVQCVFLPRHGRGHPIPPSRLNFRANIDALKRAGVTDILSLSAVGSLKEELPPGHFVLVDQFIDRSFAREKSFFDTGCGACRHGGPGFGTCARCGAGRGGFARNSIHAGRDVSGDGRPAVLNACGERVVPVLGLFGRGHDEHAGSQART